MVVDRTKDFDRTVKIRAILEQSPDLAAELKVTRPRVFTTQASHSLIRRSPLKF